MTQETQALLGEAEQHFTHLNLLDLLNHLEHTHHALTREELARGCAWMKELLASANSDPPFLDDLAQILDDLSLEFSIHLERKEQTLFPYVRTLATLPSHGPLPKRPVFQSVLNPIRVLHQENEAIMLYLQRVQELTENFTPPPQASPTLKALYRSLDELHANSSQYLHLENKVLFPQMLWLEQQVFTRPH